MNFIQRLRLAFFIVFKTSKVLDMMEVPHIDKGSGHPACVVITKEAAKKVDMLRIYGEKKTGFYVSAWHYGQWVCGTPYVPTYAEAYNTMIDLYHFFTQLRLEEKVVVEINSKTLKSRIINERIKFVDKRWPPQG